MWEGMSLLCSSNKLFSLCQWVTVGRKVLCKYPGSTGPENELFFTKPLCDDVQIQKSFGNGFPRASLVPQRLKRLPPMRETRVRSLGQEDPLEKEMVTPSSILAWGIPWMEKPGRLQSDNYENTEISTWVSLITTFV